MRVSFKAERNHIMSLLNLRALGRACVAIAVMASLSVVQAAETSASTATPALQSFVSEALRRHPAMQAARAELDRFRAEADAAGQPLYNPELGIEYEDTDLRERTIGLQQTFDWSDKREARASAAESALVAAKARYAAVREAFIAGLLIALADNEVAAQQARLAERSVELMRRFARLGEQRQEAGDLSLVDYNLTVLARTEAEMQLARARSRAVDAEQQIRALTIGMSGAWPALPQEPPPLRFKTDPDELLAESPAVLAARADAQSAAAIVSLRQRQRKPDPTFGLRAGKEGEEDLIGLSFSIPLFVRNSFRAEVAAAVAEERAASLDAAAIERDIRARLITAGRRYLNVRSAWQSWESVGAASLDRQIDVLEQLWQAGELGTTDYLVQLKQALDTHTGALELKLELWAAWSDWLEASARASDWVGLATGVSAPPQTR